MIDLPDIVERIKTACAGAVLETVPNESPSGQVSLAVDRAHAFEVAAFLRDDPDLRFDYCSNATGVDWLDRVDVEKVKITKEVDGEQKEVEEKRETKVPGYLEAVYHLFSIEKRHGPLVIRVRTADRAPLTKLPSLTPVWRSCEFQEREIYDLYGIEFEGHPDLRRLLMWDEFEDFPMRKDYVEPDDYEYEPTPHDEVIEKAKAHHPEEAK